MATKKYLSLERLSEYDGLIKSKIDEGDEGVKTYVDTKLAKKANTAHYHSTFDINGLQTELDGLYKDATTQSDWASNDESSVSYIKNRPFYEDNSPKIIIEGSYTFSSANGDVPANIQAYNPTALLQEGEKYIITMGSAAYESSRESSEPVVAIKDSNGEISITALIGIDIGSPNLQIKNAGYYLQVYDMKYSAQSGKTIYLKVEHIGNSIKQLDEKFIPDTIARTAYMDEQIINKADKEHNHS